MSAYSDWKCGAISEEEYDSYMEREEARDRAYYEDCMYDEEEDDEDEDDEDK